jgi:phosphatidylinositol alpha-1,6-mannosyltransferase
MRVLALVPDAFGGHGGIAKFNRDLLRALCAYPACSEVVAIPRQMPMLDAAEPLPAKLTYVTSGLGGKLHYLVTVLRVVHSNPRFDLVFCGHINLLPIAFAVRFWARAPVVLVIHGVEAWGPTSRPLTNYLASKVDAFISVSQLTKRRFLKWARPKENAWFLLPNSIDLERFRPGPKNTALLERYGLAGKTVLMTLGRLSSTESYKGKIYKGIDEVLELLPKLTEEIVDVVYLVVGDGSDRRRLEQKAKSLGLNKHVVFTGYVPEREKVDHYCLADAFVMPARGEGFGIVYLEAMACGVPVVASKVDASREVVCDGELGTLVDPDDPHEIRTGILKALNRPKGAVPKELENFTYRNFERRLHAIVEAIMSAANVARKRANGQ